MRWLVTAGGTMAPIDRVRGISNSFTGRTGARIALEIHRRGEQVELLTSHPRTSHDGELGPLPDDSRWRQTAYRTFDDLHDAMRERIASGAFDVVIHSAAVSDYVSGGIFAPAAGTAFDAASLTWTSPGSPKFTDRAAGKVKSDEPELWLRLVKAPKLIDLIRPRWGFRGTLVKFKLEVGVSDEELLAIAERSRRHSGADLMVANTLDAAARCAFIGPLAERYERVERGDLPARLFDAVASLRK